MSMILKQCYRFSPGFVYQQAPPQAQNRKRLEKDPGAAHVVGFFFPRPSVSGFATGQRPGCDHLRRKRTVEFIPGCGAFLVFFSSNRNRRVHCTHLWRCGRGSPLGHGKLLTGYQSKGRHWLR